MSEGSAAWRSLSDPEELQSFLKGGSSLAIRGGGSKTALGRAVRAAAERVAMDQPVEWVDMSSWSGVVEYQPEEYTITARAGTRLSVLEETLEAQGQFLPFDPLLIDAGSTVGGAIASRANGPGRIRYGGVRDFLIGVRFVDGLGTPARGGGKVVKNAAGFDLPKLFCGSVGRLCVLTEATFKVFPRPAAWSTSSWEVDGGDGEGLSRLERAHVCLCRAPFELYGLELLVGSKLSRLTVRLGGLPETLEPRTKRIESHLSDQIEGLPSPRRFDSEEDLRFWRRLRELDLDQGAGPAECVLKVGLTPGSLVDLRKTLRRIEGVDLLSLGAGGQRAFVSASGRALEEVDLELRGLGLGARALTARLDVPTWLGARPATGFLARVERALDPKSRLIGVRNI